MKKLICLAVVIALTLSTLLIPAFARVTNHTRNNMQTTHTTTNINRQTTAHGEGIGNNRTLGSITFIMFDRDNPQNILATFTTEEPIGRFRQIADALSHIPGWRVDRQTLRQSGQFADRGSRTVAIPMVPDISAQNVQFVINGDTH